MAVDTTYYTLLGVPVQATTEEIKKAYKGKARKHHPDKNPDDPEAHATFQAIAQAYETLSDPDARAAYDRYGPDSRSGPGGPGGHPGGAFDMNDIFEDFFGGHSTFGSSFFDGPGGGSGFGSFDSAGPSRAAKPKRGRDTVVEYQIGLDEAYRGKRVVMALERDRECAACEGKGGRKGAKMEKCGKCSGKGAIIQDRHLGPGLVGKMKVTCDECGGEGQRFADRAKCRKCLGKGIRKEKKRVEFQIEPGTLDGERIALKGEGDALPGVPPGDVIFTIRLRPHPLFHPRSNSGLFTTLTISLTESLLGMDRLVFLHLDGRGIRLVSARGERVMRHGDEYVVKGEGMPVRGKEGARGDLRLKIEVEMPGLSWVARQDPESLGVALPTPPKDLAPRPEEVVVRYLSHAR